VSVGSGKASLSSGSPIIASLGTTAVLLTLPRMREFY
jgi:hypothetical protein